MRTHLLAGAAALWAIPAAAQDSGSNGEGVTLGIVLGFTGPIETLTDPMGTSAERAIAEVNESGNFMDGMQVDSVRADSTCIDAGAATAAAERVITSDGVAGIVGAACSGATTAILQNVALPNGMVMISPSSTSPALTDVEDDGLFFRTAPSDARQGEIMAQILQDQDVGEVALTYTNNDYGKGLADSFQSAFEEMGGTVTINTAHEDGKGDYSAEVGELASAGGEVLVVAGYVDQGGSGIVRGALDQGAFATFHFPDGMIGAALEDNFGSEIDGSTGQHPGSDSEGADIFDGIGEEAGFDPSSPFTPESYDAAALILLAMQKAGSTDPAEYKAHVMDVANAPGEQIMPGDLGRALQLIADGQEIDYQGASAVELIEPGESKGSYRQIVIEGGEIETVQYR